MRGTSFSVLVALIVATAMSAVVALTVVAALADSPGPAVVQVPRSSPEAIARMAALEQHLAALTAQLANLSATIPPTNATTTGNPDANGAAATDGRIADIDRRLADVMVRLDALAAQRAAQPAAGADGGAGPRPGVYPVGATMADLLKAIEDLQRRQAELEQQLAQLTFTGPLVNPEPQPATGVKAGNNPDGAAWSVEQVCGAPDSDPNGDRVTAWATKEENAGIEWIEVDLGAQVVPSHVVVHQSWNPGAMTKIEMVDALGRYRTVWTGHSPNDSKTAMFTAAIQQPFTTRAVRVWLDTSRVPGWNEIDAIGVKVGNEMVWGASATASTAYGVTNPATGENNAAEEQTGWREDDYQ